MWWGAPQVLRFGHCCSKGSMSGMVRGFYGRISIENCRSHCTNSDVDCQVCAYAAVIRHTSGWHLPRRESSRFEETFSWNVMVCYDSNIFQRRDSGFSPTVVLGVLENSLVLWTRKSTTATMYRSRDRIKLTLNCITSCYYR